jgi:CRISPR type IV-associated DEAD/DEAH-box helicase Csf4
MNITILIPNAWLTPLGLPEHLHSDTREVCGAAKRALLHALDTPMEELLEEELNRDQSDSKGTSVRVMMPLPAKVASVLSAIAKSNNLTPGPTAKHIIGLVAKGRVPGYSMTAQDPPVNPLHPLTLLNKLLAKEPRYAQTQLYDNLWETLTSGHVGMIEGGTGIGKTRAMMAAAVRWVNEKQTNIGICAPTIALLRQMVAEHQRQHDVKEVPELRLIVGRREFVSEFDLTEFLTDRGSKWDSPAVREWLRTGGAVDDSGNIDVSWQVHSLQQIAPDLPVEEVRLSDICSTDDRGFRAYRAQFPTRATDRADQKSQKCPPEPPCILLFTHSMLAQDMRRKIILAGQDETYAAMQAFYFQALRNVKGKKRVDVEDDFEAIAVLESELGVALNTAADGRSILPHFTALMVDEGHLLNESFSASLSDYLSLRSVLSDLRAFRALGGNMMPQGLDIAERSIQSLILQAPTVDRRDFVALAGDGDAMLVPHISAIGTVCESISSVRQVSSDKYRLSLRIRRAGVIINSAVKHNRKSSFLRHSPIRQLPQLLVSNSNVQTAISRLWSSIESACLVSATLYMPTNDGPNASFMASLLQVPPSRLKTFAPVHESWSTECVSGVWVSKASCERLYPPSINAPGHRIKRTVEERDQAEVQWHAALAVEVKRIWESAAGGVLVLCTSYATIKSLDKALRHAGLTDSMVVAMETQSTRTQSQAFLRLSHAEKKPLWLAVGSAWTGVDIGGHDPWRDLFGQELPPEKDNVLTDLVIPRVPYGTNQSLEHLWRIRNSPSVPWDLLDAALRFKQALGRLVRRKGLPKNRRIFVLDARLGEGTESLRMSPFKQSLSRYRSVLKELV